MPQMRKKIYELKVRHLYRNLPEVTIAAFALPLIIFFSINTEQVLIWVSLYLFTNIVTLSRTWFLKSKINDVKETVELDRLVKQWKFQTYLLGCFWMVLPWIMNVNDPFSFVLLGFLISGVTVGTTVSCATFPKISFVYCSMILSSLFVYFVSKLDSQYFALAGVTILFYLLMMKMQRTLSSFINNAFALTIELEQANEKVQRSQDAAVISSRLAAQAEMTASLAHEINNPLTVIQFKAMHLKMSIEKGKLTDSTVTVAADKILDMVSRLKDIVQSTKKYFYDENDGPELVSVELGLIVDEISEVFVEKCNSHNIEFDCDKILNINVQGVKTSISQVVTNLLNNAFDSIKDDPTDGRVQLKFEERKDDVLLHIVDSGKGVSEERKEKIFEPFYTTKGKGAGLGIGLSICLALVKQMGGNLWLESSSPSTFSLSLKKL